MAQPKTTQTFMTGNGDAQRALVVVFLRGGADGLSLVPPLADDGYHRARPRIAVKPADAVKLDGFYGLHPLLKDLEPAWKDGALAVIHAVGSEDATRSHFEAQDLMEHGGLAAGGWLGRFLRHRKGATAGPLSAIALGRALPECLRGAPAATAMTSLKDFSIGAPPNFLTQLGRLYAANTGTLAAAGATRSQRCGESRSYARWITSRRTAPNTRAIISRKACGRWRSLSKRASVSRPRRWM